MSTQIASNINREQHSKTMITMTATNDLHNLIDSRFEDLARRILDELKQSKYSEEFFKALDLILLEPIESEFNKLHENTMNRLIEFRSKKIEAQQRQQQLIQKQYENIEQRQVSIESQLQKFGSALVDTNLKSKQLEQQQQQQQLKLAQSILANEKSSQQQQQQPQINKQKSSIPTSTILNGISGTNANSSPTNILVTQPSLGNEINEAPSSTTGGQSTQMYPVMKSSSDNMSALRRQSSLRQPQHKSTVTSSSTGQHNLVADIVAQRQQLDQQTAAQRHQTGSILKKSSSQTNATQTNYTHAQVVSISDKPATIHKNNGYVDHDDHDGDDDDDDYDDDDDDDDDESSFGQLTSFPHRSSICVQKFNGTSQTQMKSASQRPANDCLSTGENLAAQSADRSKIMRLDKQGRQDQSSQQQQQKPRQQNNSSIVRSSTLGASDTKARFFKHQHQQQVQQQTHKQPRQFKQPESSDQPRSMILSTKEMASLYKPHMNYSTSALGNYRLSDDDEIIIIPTTISPSLISSASPDAMDQANADELSERFSISRTKSFWEKLSKGKESHGKQSSGEQNNNSAPSSACHQQPLITSPSSSSVSPQPNSVTSALGGRNSANGVSSNKGNQILRDTTPKRQSRQQQQQQQQQQLSSRNHLLHDRGGKQLRSPTAADSHQLDRMDSTGGSNSNYSCSSSGDEATSGCGNVITVNGSDTSPIKSTGGSSVSSQRRQSPKSQIASNQQQQKQQHNNYQEKTISQLQAEMMSRQNKFRQTR